MEQPFDYSQDGYALTILGQAADAMGSNRPLISGEDRGSVGISNRHNPQHNVQQFSYQIPDVEDSVGQVNNVTHSRTQHHTVGVGERRMSEVLQHPHGTYDPSVLSARTMEPLAFAPSSYGEQNGSQNSYTYPCGLTGVELNVSGPFPGNHGDIGGNLGILSAESYDDGRGGARLQEDVNVRRRVVDHSLPFGMRGEPASTPKSSFESNGEQDVVMNHIATVGIDAGMSHEIRDEAPADSGKKRKRKQRARRSQSAEEDEDGAKKSRGRPRVDPKDETPAERRRTQIRLAQRAYRNRKETTITSLEKTVNELKGNNEQMSNAFMKLFDFAVSQGILQREPELAKRLQDATQMFASLAKSSATNGSSTPDGNSVSDQGRNESDEVNGGGGKKGEAVAPLPRQFAPPITNHANPWGGYIVTNDDTSYEQGDQGDQQYQSSSSDQSSSMQIITRPTEDNASFPFDFLDLQNFNAVFSPAQSFEQSFMHPNPPAPATLAFSEASFARRLHRNTTEMALKLACMRNPPPPKWTRVFGICSQFESKDMIIARLKRVLAASSKETLQQWREPFVHLGGAGTHYPMREEDNSTMPKFQTGYSMGPFPATVTQFQDKIHDYLTLKNLPVNDVYFDSNDIECYLLSLGISITPAADYVQAEVDLVRLDQDCQETAHESSSTTTTTLPNTPPQVHASSSVTSSGESISELNLGFNTTSVSSVSIPAAFQGVELRAPDLASNYSPAFNQYSAPHDIPSTRDLGRKMNVSPQRTVVNIDVSKFVEELVAHCTCLGRAPGFRPCHVNQALRTAIRAAGFST